MLASQLVYSQEANRFDSGQSGGEFFSAG